MKKEKIFVYGRHALLEALSNSPRAVDKIFLASRDDAELEAAIKKAGISVGELKSAEVERGASHQGVIGRITLERLLLTYEEFTKNLNHGPNTSLVLLGGLQDPQNVGSIIRSAAAFGVAGVLIPSRGQAPITGAVTKVSAGMVFRMPIVEIDDPVETIKDLKRRGFTVYGLEGTSKSSVAEEAFERPAVFVMGNESKGFHGGLDKLCDRMIAVPMNKRCESLNVAASAAITFYAWSLRHKGALG